MVVVDALWWVERGFDRQALLPCSCLSCRRPTRTYRPSPAAAGRGRGWGPLGHPNAIRM